MHALYLQLFFVNLLVELYSIIWIKKVDLYFLKKKVNRSFAYCCQCFKCLYIKAVDSGSSAQFILDNTLFRHLVVYIFLV